MKIAVTGASGLVGKTLVPALKQAGHEVVKLVRSTAPSSDEIAWNPEIGKIDAEALEGVEVVIHLAGENIAGGRWSTERKRRIRDSRIEGTGLLATTLAKLKKRPRVLMTASAIGYYGDRGSAVLTEDSAPGKGFLAEVCRDWEKAAEPATQKGMRVCFLRFGVILSLDGGALKKMLPPFKMGLGGVMGSGRQYWSWVGIDDVIGATLHCMNKDSLKGPINVVAPQPVTNLEFTKTLGHVLGRPTFLPMPTFAARLVIGEMADALLLASARVEPMRLMVSGYDFRHPDLEVCLNDLLNQ